MTMHIMREKIRSQWKTIEWDVEDMNRCEGGDIESAGGFRI
jgi:hypothetical protein